MHTTAFAARPSLDQQPPSSVIPHATSGSSEFDSVEEGSDEAHHRDFIDIFGSSGRLYRFSRLRAGHPLSPAGGAFILARRHAGRLELVYVGVAESLLRDTGRLWDRAIHLFRADQMFSRLNVSGRARELELADILATLRPPMNAAERMAG